MSDSWLLHFITLDLKDGQSRVKKRFILDKGHQILYESDGKKGAWIEEVGQEDRSWYL